MYTVVLMAALTSGGDTVDFNHRRGYACYGASTCYGYFGGYCYGHGPQHHRYVNYNTYSGYTGYGGYYGGIGGGYPCYCWWGGHGGQHPRYYGGGGYGCFGGGGCYNGCYSPYFPTTPAYGPGAPGTPIMPPAGGLPGTTPGAVVPEGGIPAPAPGAAPLPAGGAPGTNPGGAPPAGAIPGQINAPAKLIVELPADAQLYVDDHLTTSKSARRVFMTPTLQAGKGYFYNLRAVVERDGQTIAVRGRVVVRPGQEISAVLSEPTPNSSFVFRVNEQ